MARNYSGRRASEVLNNTGSGRLNGQAVFFIGIGFVFLCLSIMILIAHPETLGISKEKLDSLMTSAQSESSVGTDSDFDNDAYNVGNSIADYYPGLLSTYGLNWELIPEYYDTPYFVVAERPVFPDLSPEAASFANVTVEVPWESYGSPDFYGRCSGAFANVCEELMPVDERGDISEVHPSGWQTSTYDFIEGEYLYNRCHLIGYQMTGENANANNLITGTRYFNVTGMLPFENMVADYVRGSENHVLYRVTPVYANDEKVARGVLMEGLSVEDDGASVCFCVFVYNVQPGVRIDYMTGDNYAL